MEHFLTIDLEEAFQSFPVPRRDWDSFPSRIDRNVEAALDLLRRTETRATFFVGDWVAARRPGLLDLVAREGHEIGCSIDRWSAARCDALVREVEAASGARVVGCRIAPDPAIDRETRRRCAGSFAFESSFTPALSRVRGGPRCAAPAPSLGMFGLILPIEALRLRHGPDAVARASHWARGGRRTLSLRLWELDRDTPAPVALSRAQRWLCWRNLARIEPRLRRLLEEVRFVPVGEGLGLTGERASAVGHGSTPAPVPAAGDRCPLTVVTPCFNEEEGLAHLGRALDGMAAAFGPAGGISFVLVDDGSTDGTWREMQRLFAGDPRFRLIRHDRNRGIGAATLTGLAAAQTEAVAVIDSDCSYDPAYLEQMLPRLEPDVALVTASPYHALGGVAGVPRWRLFLSRGASRLYGMLLSNKLATYTSCFRIYRKSALDGLRPRRDDFIGVAETLALLDLRGWRIVEHPVVLRTRIFGRSKLKVARTIAGHLGLLTEIAAARALGVHRGAPIVSKQLVE